jgi:hypothetical protein
MLASGLNVNMLELDERNDVAKERFELFLAETFHHK